MIIAGQPGAGKSVFLRQAITNLIVNTKGDSRKLQLYLVDLKKGVELSLFEGCTNVAGTAWVPSETVTLAAGLERELNKRYNTFRKLGVNKISDFKGPMPKIVCFVDEYALLKQNKETQATFSRLLALGRAAGIYFCIATQRPDSQVLPGEIKALCDVSLCFQVRNRTNSMIVLDTIEAINLPMIPGRGLLQTDRTREVQVPYLPEAKAKELIRPFIREKKQITPGNVSGVVPC